ncbi:MAG: TrbG/VirB9 family P-type conjugative transfer protein [Negativicoccus succinicivorans]|nr:TrbG/VirB9 family P-type conjugative transfer protein [Negativicoccus succinicivorans]
MKSTKKGTVLAAALALVLTGGSFTIQAHQPGYVAPTTENLVGSNVVFEFNENMQYKVRVKIGYLTDIMMRAGETVQGVVAGDTERWKITVARVSDTDHVYIKPLENNIETNLIVNTNNRSYRFVVSSGDVFDDVISFKNVPASRAETQAYEARMEKERKIETSNQPSIRKANQDYEYRKIKNVSSRNLPTVVFDDGLKTYISIPSDNRQELPVVYNSTNKKKMNLVNYRIKDGYMVVDSIMAEITLTFGEDSYALLRNIPEYEKTKITKEQANQLLNRSKALPRKEKTEMDSIIESLDVNINVAPTVNKTADKEEVKKEVPAVVIVPITTEEKVEIEPVIAPTKKETVKKQSQPIKPRSLKEILTELQAKNKEVKQ